jgi:hypothetical protein
MEIHVNRKLIIVVSTLLALLAGVVVLWPKQHELNSSSLTDVGIRDSTVRLTHRAPESTTTPEQASVAFVQAFYTVNHGDYDDWLEGLKAVSTAEGFAILTTSIVPAVWPELETAKTVTPAEAVSAQDAGLVLGGDSQIGGPWQIRKVNVQVVPGYLWPTMKSSDFPAILMLARQDGHWRFVSFVTPEQIEQLQKGQQP